MRKMLKDVLMLALVVGSFAGGTATLIAELRAPWPTQDACTATLVEAELAAS
jgi:hypothetical protein